MATVCGVWWCVARVCVCVCVCVWGGGQPMLLLHVCLQGGGSRGRAGLYLNSAQNITSNDVKSAVVGMRIKVRSRVRGDGVSRRGGGGGALWW
jgi:hypothetical protein